MMSANEKFARTVFRNGAIPWATCFSNYPPPGDEGRSSWRGFPVVGEWPAALDNPKANCFISNGSIRDPTKSNTDDNFNALHAIVCDDVGVKVDANKLNISPSAIVRTSNQGGRASHQYWYFLRSPIRDITLAKQVVKAMIAAELTDAGAGRVIQYYRLPVGTNSKPEYLEPFQHELIWFQPEELHDIEDLIDGFGLALEPVKKADREPLASGSSTFTDDQLLERARKSAGGPEFRKLFDAGDVADYCKGNSTGMSEATLGLLNRLAFWSNRDAAQMDRLFRRSALMRDKWDQRRGQTTWGEQQIEKAIAGTEETWKDLQERPQMMMGAGNTEAGGGSTGFVLDPVDELLAAIRGTQYLIKPFIESDTLTMIFGESGSLKSFVMLDILLCVATGLDFHGAKIRKPGPSVLLCGEGRGGVTKRVHAWRLARGWTGPIPLLVSRLPAAMLADTGPAAPAAVAQAIEDACLDRFGCPPSIVGIDTLSTNFGPGDENDNAEAGRVIGRASEHFRARFGGAAVCFVHHVGHGDKGRERGAYTLRANTDARIRIAKREGSPGCEMHSEKVKDGREWEPLVFDSHEITLPGIFDSEGEQESSLALTLANGATPEAVKGRPEAKPSRGRPADARAKVFAVLHELYAECRANIMAGGRDAREALVMVCDWRSRAIATGACVDRKRFHDAKAALVDHGEVVIEGPHALLPIPTSNGSGAS